MTTILAIDLGKFQSQACFYQVEKGTHEFKRINSSPAAMADLLREQKVQKVVIEATSMSGWVVEVAQALEVKMEVVNCNQEAWRWRNVKNKTDKLDALKLARMSALNQLSLVHVPSRPVRQWRSLIQYRHKLVQRRVAISNSIGSILAGQGLTLKVDLHSAKAVAEVAQQAQALERCGPEELWRGQLASELVALEQVEALIEPVEKKLAELAKEDPRVELVQSVPGVGERTAELIVAWIDDPKRFSNGRQVGAYAGLTPRRYQSGQMERQGRISRAGCGNLRKLLVQAAWAMVRYSPVGRSILARISKGQRTRRKQAIVALARRLLVWCWAILRDNRAWEEGKTAAMAVGA